MMRAENFLRPAVALAGHAPPGRSDILIGIGRRTRLDVFRKWVG